VISHGRKTAGEIMIRVILWLLAGVLLVGGCEDKEPVVTGTKQQ